MAKTLDLNGVTLTRAFEWLEHLMTREELIPDSDRAEWETNRSWLVPDFWNPETDTAWMASQVVVVKSSGKTILIDTGIGNFKSRPQVPPFDNLQTDFLATLRSAGAEPADVDIVINTHLHADHVGWNTRADGDQWVPTFPNATYLFPKADFDYWNPEAKQEPPAGLAEAVFADSVLPVVHAGQVEFYEGRHVIDEHVELVPAVGHTPGFSVVLLRSGSDKAIFAGDILHSPMEILQPQHGVCLDEDSVLALKSRQLVLAKAAEERAPLLTNHFPTDRAAVIGEHGDSFVIEEWVTY
jgi:glyoxylase-like metal-dependent hydrolase (beta-lactamase superfamily II)